MCVCPAENSRDLFIEIGNNSDGSSAQQCAHEPGLFAPSETRVYTCPCGMYGRCVRIRYPVNQSSYLSLCEVQIQPAGKRTIFNYCYLSHNNNNGGSGLKRGECH